MKQYNNNSFPRDRFQWSKCVINYLVDAFNPNILDLIVFLTEVNSFKKFFFKYPLFKIWQQLFFFFLNSCS